MEGMEYEPDMPIEYPRPSVKTSVATFSKDIFVRQVMEKARNQAKQLHEKEDYIMLCEKRILELYPDQQLPIVEEHLGKVPYELLKLQPLIAELNELKKTMVKKDKSLEKYKKQNKELQDKLEQLTSSIQEVEESLTSQINDLQKQKQAIEQSLRAEILINEEQRSHIKILKEAMGGRTMRCSNHVKSSTQLINLPTQIGNNKNTMHKGLLTRVNSEEVHVKEDTKKIEMWQEKVNKLVNELKEAQSLNVKLGKDKDVALNNMKQLKDEYESKLESLNVLYKKISEEKLLSDKQIEELQVALKEHEAELELNKNSIKEYINVIKTVQDKLEIIFAKHSLKDVRAVSDSLKVITNYVPLAVKEESKANSVKKLEENLIGKELKENASLESSKYNHKVPTKDCSEDMREQEGLREEINNCTAEFKQVHTGI